jgi:putative ABC transport system substrate-binding protein
MASHVERRKFLATLGGAAAAWPVAARAQSSTIHRIGWMSLAAPEDAETSPYFEEFRAGLRDLGYVEGRNITIDARWTHGEAVAWPLAARAEQWPTDRRQVT